MWPRENRRGEQDLATNHAGSGKTQGGKRSQACGEASGQEGKACRSDGLSRALIRLLKTSHPGGLRALDIGCIRRIRHPRQGGLPVETARRHYVRGPAGQTVMQSGPRDVPSSAVLSPADGGRSGRLDLPYDTHNRWINPSAAASGRPSRPRSSHGWRRAAVSWRSAPFSAASISSKPTATVCSWPPPITTPTT
jgi:hypothetical protein